MGSPTVENHRGRWLRRSVTKYEKRCLFGVGGVVVPKRIDPCRRDEAIRFPLSAFVSRPERQAAGVCRHVRTFLGSAGSTATTTSEEVGPDTEPSVSSRRRNR